LLLFTVSLTMHFYCLLIAYLISSSSLHSSTSSSHTHRSYASLYHTACQKHSYLTRTPSFFLLLTPPHTLHCRSFFLLFFFSLVIHRLFLLLFTVSLTMHFYCLLIAYLISSSFLHSSTSSSHTYHSYAFLYHTACQKHSYLTRTPSSFFLLLTRPRTLHCHSFFFLLFFFSLAM